MQNESENTKKSNQIKSKHIHKMLYNTHHSYYTNPCVVNSFSTKSATINVNIAFYWAAMVKVERFFIFQIYISKHDYIFYTIIL